MAWTAAIDTIVENALPVERTYLLELRNGYVADAGGDWTEIPIKKDGWQINVLDGNPVTGKARFNLGLENWLFLEEFNHTNPSQLTSACRLSCTVTTPGGPETEYDFRGTVRTCQIIDSKVVIEAVDPLSKMQKALAPVDMVADIDGPYIEVRLRHDDTGIYDETGTFFTYEIDPTFGAQTWAENIFGTNRAFVPGVFEVEIQNGLAWDPIAESEFIIDEPNGLIRFGNDQGALAVFRIVSVSVYIEGTLELARVIEYILSLTDDCDTQGCGFTEAQLITNLTGVITFDLADPYLVTGVGCAFLTELEVGDRFGLHGVDPVHAIVEAIANDNQLTIKFPYDQIGGTPGDNGAAFVCGLMESGISLSTIKWLKCDGKAAELYRKLQQNYSDSKGYKIWYDYELDKVRGAQVRWMDPDEPDELAKIIDLGPALKGGTKITSTTTDFATAVTVTGIIGRPRNLITDPAVAFTALAEIAGWTKFAGTHWGIWGPIGHLNDQKMETGYAVYKEVLLGDYHEFVKIDLGAVFNLSEFILYRINTKRDWGGGLTMGVNLLGSKVDIPGAYTPLSPETMLFEMEPDEERRFDLEGIASVQYIIIECRPFHWGMSGQELSMGFWELIIYGSQEVCVTACIQGEVAHGERLGPGIGNITFNAGGPPYTITGAGTNFGGGGANDPAVGDYIAITTDLDHWAIVDSITAATGVDCATITYLYGGVPGANGPLELSKGNWRFEEGEGGHFIGGDIDNPDAFMRDYYPHLLKKVSNFGHSTKMDKQGIVFTEAQAKDRAYIILNEVIRIYRSISTKHGFDPRGKLFDTVHAVDDYRDSGDEDLYYLVQGISRNDKMTIFSGTEYGAGVLE